MPNLQLLSEFVNSFPELWFPVKDWENLYMVSNRGRIKSLPIPDSTFYDLRKERIMKPFVNQNGYHRFSIERGLVKKNIAWHRIVAIAFHINPNKKRTVNHINGIKTDNRSINLEWNTHGENITHAYRLGLKIANVGFGEQHPRAKYSEKTIILIKEMFLQNVDSQTISDHTGISKNYIKCIKQGRVWKHIKI